MNPHAENLRFAQQAEKCVEITMTTGQKFMTGVHDVDEDQGLFTLYTPQHMGDETTRTTLHLADIASLSVTEISWP